MEELIASVVSLIILIPIIYFLQIGFTNKGKGLLVLLAFIFANIGILANGNFSLWQSALILLLLIILTSYVVDKRFGKLLYSGVHNHEKKEMELQQFVENKMDKQIKSVNNAALLDKQEFPKEQISDNEDSEIIEKNENSTEIHETTVEMIIEESPLPQETSVVMEDEPSELAELPFVQLEKNLIQEDDIMTSELEDEMILDDDSLSEDINFLSERENRIEESIAIDDISTDQDEISDQDRVGYMSEIEQLLQQEGFGEIEDGKSISHIADLKIQDDFDIEIEENSMLNEFVDEEDTSHDEEVILAIEEEMFDNRDETTEWDEIIPLALNEVAASQSVEEDEDKEQMDDIPLIELYSEIGSNEDSSPNDIEEMKSINSFDDIAEEIDIIENFVEDEAEELHKKGMDRLDEPYIEGNTGMDELELEQLEERTALQQQMFQTMVSQIHLLRKQMKEDDYENLVKNHLHPDLSPKDYYTFASLLIEHYISRKELGKLQDLLSELKKKVNNYPILVMEIQFLYEHYCENGREMS